MDLKGIPNHIHIFINLKLIIFYLIKSNYLFINMNGSVLLYKWSLNQLSQLNQLNVASIALRVIFF